MLVEARLRDSMSLRHATTWALVTVASVRGRSGATASWFALCARTNLPSLAIRDLPLGFRHPTGTRGSADTLFFRASEG